MRAAALLLALGATAAGATPPPPVLDTIAAPPPIPAELRPPQFRAVTAPPPAPTVHTDRRALAALALTVGVLTWREMRLQAAPGALAVTYRMEF